MVTKEETLQLTREEEQALNICEGGNNMKPVKLTHFFEEVPLPEIPYNHKILYNGSTAVYTASATEKRNGIGWRTDAKPMFSITENTPVYLVFDGFNCKIYPAYYNFIVSDTDYRVFCPKQGNGITPAIGSYIAKNIQEKLGLKAPSKDWFSEISVDIPFGETGEVCLELLELYSTALYKAGAQESF